MTRAGSQTLCILLLAGPALCVPALGHHTLVTAFDVENSFELRGTITSVEWLNPHVWLHLNASNAEGEVERWYCELGSPGQLQRAGWKERDLPPGTVIRAQANRARDGSLTCATRNIFLDDGTPILTPR